jgi:hypothetical protein
MRKALASSMRRRPLYLVGIVVQTNDITTRESRYLSGRFANTTANIKHSHRLIDPNAMGKIMLVTRKSLEKRFAHTKTTQVERLGPAFFVEVGG